MNKHFRKTMFKRNFSLQFFKYDGSMYQFGFKIRYDSMVKSFAVVLTLGLYNAFFLAYKKV